MRSQIAVLRIDAGVAHQRHIDVGVIVKTGKQQVHQLGIGFFPGIARSHPQHVLNRDIELAGIVHFRRIFREEVHHFLVYTADAALFNGEAYQRRGDALGDRLDFGLPVR